MDRNQPCPCGSDHPYEACCGVFHGGAKAPTPEALMRSRFSAFVLGKADYLRQTWHTSTRPTSLNLDDSPRWQSLSVLSASQHGDQGTVHFRAVYKDQADWGYLEEASEFIREFGVWYYLAGNPTQGVLKPGRNDHCPCGSGRKYKNCCLA
ncbi:YchJ family protein [Marinobacter caseinilyticus]|uniref:YchJ family protein n=1 Tax=Marinobacter caseinilyticus TaxID=2692195 RepID=UPI00140913C2|nr:YchJ family protein [Marinobacter caseinilyticus]